MNTEWHHKFEFATAKGFESVMLDNKQATAATKKTQRSRSFALAILYLWKSINKWQIWCIIQHRTAHHIMSQDTLHRSSAQHQRTSISISL